MSNFGKFILAGLAFLLITGCNGNPDDLPGLLYIRVTHASPDTPVVSVEITGFISTMDSSLLGPLGTLTLPAVDYKQSSGLRPVRVGNTTVKIEAIIPDGNVVVADLSFAETEDVNYEIMLVGKWGDPDFEALQFDNPRTDVGAGNFRVQVVHAAPDVGEDIIVYITTPGAALDSGQQIAFAGNTGQIEFPAGEYQIRIALASDAMTPVFDTNLGTPPEGVDLLIAAVTNTGAGSAPISVILLDGTGTPNERLDDGTPADVRFVHTLPDDPDTLDIIIENDDPPGTEIVSGLAFAAFTDYLNPALEPETYNFKFVDSATGTMEVINRDVTIEAGVAYTMIAAGLFANAPGGAVVDAVVDDNRRVATEAKFRLLHSSNAADAVDVYLAAQGDPIGEDNRVLSGFTIQGNSGYGSIAAGPYELTVTQAGDTADVLIDAQPITLADGGIYTTILIDSAPGVLPLQLILMDDFAP